DGCSCLTTPSSGTARNLRSSAWPAAASPASAWNRRPSSRPPRLNNRRSADNPDENRFIRPWELCREALLRFPRSGLLHKAPSFRYDHWRMLYFPRQIFRSHPLINGLNLNEWRRRYVVSFIFSSVFLPDARSLS